MIPRYSRSEMTDIWEPENKFRIWFEIEAHACDAQAALGVIPESAAKTVWEKGAWEIDRIDDMFEDVAQYQAASLHADARLKIRAPYQGAMAFIGGIEAGNPCPARCEPCP